jgi:predicted NAD-dependent protein-ADP-ribosyltransferase YbiA (DUF1768 family)
MPDFNKDLTPKIIPNAPGPIDMTQRSISVPQTASQISNQDFRGTEGVMDRLKKASAASNPVEKGVYVTNAELDANKRYREFNPTIPNYEDFAAYGQSVADKAANGLLKGLNLAGTTIAGSFGMLYGAVKSPFSGRLADIWDNDATRALDEWNTKVDQEYLPNYYTDAEKNAAWYSMDNWFKANFLFDKLIKNSGFAVGAMVTGNIANTSLLKAGQGLGKAAMAGATAAESSQAFKLFTPLLRNTARAFSNAKNVEAAAVLEKEISSIADLSTRTSKLGELAKTTNQFANFGNTARRTAVAAYSSAGEASFEALGTAKEFRDKLIEEHINKTGSEPDADALRDINAKADKIGKASFFGNLALLSATEYVQLPKLLGSNYSSSKQAANSLLGQVKEVGLKEGAYVATKATTKFGKVANRVKGVTRYVYDPKEAAQEGLQYALQVGTQNYYNKAFQSDNADVLVDGFLYGLFGTDKYGQGVGALNSKEGMESIALGGITGGLMQMKGNIQEAKQLKTNTAAFLGQLNSTPGFKQSFVDRMNSVNRANVLQQQQQDAVIQGDKLEAKDIDADLMHNYLATRIKYGRFDMVKGDINDLNMESMTDEGLSTLKEQGIANINDTKESFQARLATFEKVANYTNELYKALDLRYSGVQNEDGTKKYSSEVVDKLVYASAKVANYDLRIPQVNNTLMVVGINTSEILQSIIKDFKPNKEATDKAIAQINELDVTSDIKDELKTNLSDIIEMSLRRKLFIDEYDAIKDKPEDFQRKPIVGFGATEEVPVTVEQEEEPVAAELGEQIELFPGTKERKLEIGKDYYLKQPVTKEDNTLTLAPKIRVLSQTLGGELEVQLPRGNVSFLSPEQFKKLNLAEEGAESPELRDIMDSAIDNVLSKPEFADIVVPEGEDKLEYINSLNNAALTDAIEAEFSVNAEDYLKQQADLQANRNKMSAAADKIKSAQTDIAATSGVVPTGSNDEDLMNTPKESPKKDAGILFTSSSSASIDWNKTLAPNVTRYNEFINKVKDFKNRKNIKAIVVSQKQEAALGLSGLGELSFREGNFDTSLLNDPVEGFIGLVFVEDKKGERQFIDKNGNPVGKVGEQVDLNKVVFTSMPAAKLTNSKGEPRYRAGQEEQANAELAGYQVYRDQLMSASADSYQVFDFTPSKGIAVTDDVKKPVGDVLIPESQIATQQVIKVVTQGAIDHVDGISYIFPNGRPVFQSQDTLEFLNNSPLTKDQAAAVYNVLKAMSADAKLQIANKKAVKFREIHKRFLQGVTFYTNAEAVAKGVGKDSFNRIYIEGSTLHIGDNTYDFANLEKSEERMMSNLQGIFHNVNSFTINLGLGEPFVEMYVGSDGVLAQRFWKNYQSYLLASKNPDGSARLAPLTTNVVKATEAVPYTHKQKYIILNGLELPTQSVAKPAAPEFETYKSNVGDVTYKVTTDSKGDFTVELVGENPNIKKIADSPELLAMATQQLKDLGKFDELDEPIETAAKFAAEFITAKLISERKTAAPAAAPVVSDIEGFFKMGPGAIHQQVLDALNKKTNIIAGYPNREVNMLKPFYDQGLINSKEDVFNKLKELSSKKVSVSDEKADAQTVKNRMQEIEKQPITINITQDANDKMEQTSEEVVLQIKAELDKIGLPYSDVMSNDKGSTYFVVTKDGQQHQILKLVKMGNLLVKPILTKAKWINHLIKTQPQDLYNFVNAELAALEAKKINIYAGTGENAELSNFAIRPFEDKTEWQGLTFKSVEGAFQAAKIQLSNMFDKNDNLTKEGDELLDKLQEASGAEAKALGRKVTGLNVKEWDRLSSKIMKGLLLESFKQNPTALQKLLATGNTELTHTQDKGKWGKEFPKLLMEVRSELASQATPVSDQPKNINIGGPEYRRVGRTDVARINDSEIALFKEWHAKNASNIPYEILENVISINDTEKAWGAFENGVAKFFKGAQRGTEYHEIFEGIWKGFLSKGEQQAVIDEFKNQSGSFLDRESGRRIDYANATDQQAKERIADDFAEFRLGKLPARNLKERVRNFFKALMEFFKSFVTKPSLKEDLFKSIDTGEFADRTLPETVKNEAAQYRKIEGISAKQTNEFVQDITARVFGEIFANNRSLFNIEDITASDLFNRIKEQYIKNNVIGEDPVTQISENQYVKLVERAKEFLKTYRIEFDEDSRVTVNDDGANRKDYAAEAFTVNFKKSSPYAVKLLIGTLIKTKGLNQETSAELRRPDADISSIGGLKLLPFNQAFTTLMGRLSNTRSVPEFVSKLHELAKQNSDYVRLFERLGGNLKTGKIDFDSYQPHDIRLFTNFYQVFTKQRPDALAMFMDGNNVYTAPANQASSIAGIRSEWIENMKTKAEQTGSIISFNGKVYKVKKADYNIKYPQDKVAFLADLGIDFPMAVYNKVKNKKAFSEAVTGIKTGLSKTDELMGFGDRKLGIRTQLNELAKLYTVAASPAEDSTYFGVDGNRIQSDTDANYPSLLEYTFNSSDTLEELKQNLPQLNDVFSTNSQVLKLGGNFFDEQGNRIAEIKVQYIQGVKDVIDNEGQTTSALSIGDRYITEINQNLDGRYYVLIPADSSREWMMDLGNTIAYTDVAAGNADSLFTDTFLGYLKDEIKLAQDSTNRAKLRNVGDKATELRFLKDMLPATLLKKINTLIEKRASEADIDSFIAENRKDKDEQPGLESSILKSLDDTITKTRQNLVETQKVIASKNNGAFIMSELENRFTEKAGLNKFALTDQEINDVIKFANANYMINNVEFHKVLFGDPYQFEVKGNQLDETKRIKSFLSPRRITLNTDQFNNLFNKQYNTVAGVQLTPNDYGYHEHKNFAKTLTAADVNVTDSFYPKSNEADAASWIMDAAYKEVKLKNGQWSDDAEDWHQWQMAYTRQNVPGYTYSSDALRKHDEALLQQPEPKFVTEVLKPIVSGNKYGKAYIDLVLDKFSQMPLYYKAVEGTNLSKFYEKMFKEGYDYTVVVSGRKEGAEKLHKLYNADGSFNEEAFNNTINVGWDSYGIQVENSYDKDSKQTLGSQLTKLSTVDLYNNGKAINEDARKAVEKNTEVLKEMLLNGYNELLGKLGIEDLGDNFVVTDKTTIANTLRQEMLKREMSENGIDSISIDPDTGEFYIPFEASTNYIQIKDILYSIVDKSVVSPKVSGFPAVQVPVTMWEKAGESRGEGLKKSALKFYTKADPYMEVYLPAWFKNQLVKAGLTEKTDEELLEILKDSEILKGIGFRIPTQGLNSAEVFKIKGFLPEFMGKTIVVPSEITTKSGSDFDIDKLNLYLKNIYVTPSGKIKSVPFFGYGEQAKEAIKNFIFEEDIKAMLDINSEISGSRVDDYGTLADRLYKQSLENEYFRSIETLLTLEDNFDRLTAPNTDKTLKKIADRLDELRVEDEGDIKNRLLDRNYMTNQRHAFLTGKRWIGIAAVNITGNSLAQKTNIFVENPQTEMVLKHNKFTDGGFDHISLSGMKDQAGEYISDKLSMYANAFVDIAKDPYIMKIIYSNRIVGTFMLLERAGVPMNTVAMFMNQPIIREHIKNLDANSAPRYAISNAEYIKQAKLQFPANQKAIQNATISEGNFEDNISAFASKTMTEAQNAEQHKILNEFLSYVTLADENFNFTQAINYDTTTFRNADDFYRKELMTDRAQDKGAISSPQKVLDSSFLGTEKTVLDQSNSALGAILKFNQPEFRGVLEDTIQQYAEKFYIAKDKFNRVAEKATASLLDYIIQTGRKNPLNISELSFGPESVAVKLEEAKQKYPNKQILQDLVVVSAERPNSPKTIKLRANVKEAYDENMYIGMMRELRDDPNTNQLYKDLIKAAIIQGTYQSAVSIKNIIPIEDYSTEVKNIVNTTVVDENVREFSRNNWYQRNNWKNSDITPSITPYIDEESITELGEFKNQMMSQYKFTGFVEIPEIGIGENDKLVLTVGEKSKAAGYDIVTIPRIITTKYGERIDFITGRTVTKAAYDEMKAKGDPMINQVFGYQKVKFVGGEALRTYKGKFVFKMVNLYGDGQFISEYHKFNKPSELDNNTGKVTDEIPNSEIVKYFTGIKEKEVNSQPETETDLTTKDFKCKF